MVIHTHHHHHLSLSLSPLSTPTGPIMIGWSVDEVQQRWHSAISVFAHIFLAEGPGSERSNFLNAKAGFASRMARYYVSVSVCVHVWCTVHLQCTMCMYIYAYLCMLKCVSSNNL